MIYGIDNLDTTALGLSRALGVFSVFSSSSHDMNLFNVLVAKILGQVLNFPVEAVSA